jgi:hypothetical protein
MTMPIHTNNISTSILDVLASRSKSAASDTAKLATSDSVTTGNKYSNNAEVGAQNILYNRLQSSGFLAENSKIKATSLEHKCATAYSMIKNIQNALNDLNTDIVGYSKNPKDQEPAVQAGITNVLTLLQQGLNVTYDDGKYVFGSGDKSPIQDNVLDTPNYGTDNVPSASYVADPAASLNLVIAPNLTIDTYLDPGQFKNLIAGLHQLQTAISTSPAPKTLPDAALGYFNQGVKDVANMSSITVNLLWNNAKNAISTNETILKQNAEEFDSAFKTNATEIMTTIKASEDQNKILQVIQAMTLRRKSIADFI